jgi:hypothetical protein
MNKNRYIYDNEILDIIKRIKDFFKYREVFIENNPIFYRAQKGCICPIDDDLMPIPYKAERMFPLAYSAREGRANPKGISYLYLADNLHVALCEVRGWPGDYVSVAKLIANKDLKFVDFSSDETKSPLLDLVNFKFLASDNIEEIWGELNHAFSRPVSNNDDVAEYALTQMIAECVKNAGYDGLIYNSGYSSEECSGKNYVMFNKNVVNIQTAEVYYIKQVKVDYRQESSTYFYNS